MTEDTYGGSVIKELETQTLDRKLVTEAPFNDLSVNDILIRQESPAIYEKSHLYLININPAKSTWYERNI